MGATSLTEKWDAGVGNFGSQNHFMSGQINEWFFHDLVGINPDENGAGFRSFTIKPAVLRGLNWVNGSYHSISGDIVCHWKKEAERVTMNVVVPPNTTAVIYIPAKSEKDIKEGRARRIRQQTVWLCTATGKLCCLQGRFRQLHILFGDRKLMEENTWQLRQTVSKSILKYQFGYLQRPVR